MHLEEKKSLLSECHVLPQWIFFPQTSFHYTKNITSLKSKTEKNYFAKFYISYSQALANICFKIYVI